MKKVYYSFVFLTFCLDLLFAQGQQLPNSNCNDWSGAELMVKYSRRAGIIRMSSK